MKKSQLRQIIREEIPKAVSEDFDLKGYLAENKLLKEEIMVDTTVMVDPNNTLMSNASDEEIAYIEANLTNVPKMEIEDFMRKYDEYFDRFYGEGDPLDLQIKALQIHIDKGVLTREEAIEALAMLQGQDVEDYEDMFLAEGKLLKENRELSQDEVMTIYNNFMDTHKYKETVIDDPDGTKENATLKIDTPDGKSYKVLTSAIGDEKWWKWDDDHYKSRKDEVYESKEFNFKSMIKEALTPHYLK